ncbi:hypothetical protein F4802DRAFT_570277 [Xylaria palmicola]|nr:hypothetical protein F4802DRAFT_570277 [Xylaria palmicola]
MAVGVSSRLRSYIRRKLEKRKTCGAHTSTSADVVEGGKLPSPVTPTVEEPAASHPKIRFDEQHGSTFFQSLPLEIRKMIYAYVWQGPYDHMYHEPNGRHLHFRRGHWVHTRCVMYEEDDEDADFIQEQMDLIRRSGRGDLLLWQRRLASTWGQRHWRCAERIEYSEPTPIDRTGLGALMVVCKKMHPEVMESFLERHKIVFNDVFSAHRFLVRPGASRRLARHLRHLDLTLSVPFHELAPFLAIGPPDSDDDGGGAETTTTTTTTTWPPAASSRGSRLGAVFAALAESPTCLHGLRVSLDVYDRGPWRKLPERALASHLARIPVRRGRAGEVNYTVELPPALPIRTHYAGLQDLGDDDEAREDGGVGEGEGGGEGRLAAVVAPFHVTRRPPLRYWQFNPGEVEHFTWETRDGEREHQHCWIALSKATRHISNPYLVDFNER